MTTNITAHTATQENFDSTTLRRLAEVKGDCLSFFLPDRRPGTSTGDQRTQLRQLVNEARVVVHNVELREQMTALIDDANLSAGGPGLAIFCSRHGIESLRVPGIKKAEFVFSDHFNLAPVMMAALTPREQFILGISRKKMRLFHWKDGVAAEAAWPVGAPVGLDEAEHGRVETVGNHVTSAKSSSMMASVQFGSENRPDHEGAGHHLTHFFRMVDAGLAPVLAGVPLLLGGVEDEILAYRKAAKYPVISEQEIPGSMEHMLLSEIAAHAQRSAAADLLAEGAKASAACRANKPVSDPQEILAAAEAGRVHRLIVPEGSSDDRANAAITATLRMGGEIFVVRDEPMVAALRY